MIRKLFALFILSTSLSFATDYYVKTNGNDALSGTSVGNAWATISKANNTLVAGDRVLVLGGEYSGQINPVNSGSAGNYITYIAYDAAWRPILRPASGPSANLSEDSYIRVEGFGMPRGFDIYKGSHNIFRNDSCAFDTQGKTISYGVGDLNNTAFNTIRRCFFNANDGMYAEYGSHAGVAMSSDDIGGGCYDNLVDSCMSIQSSDIGYSTFGWQGFNRNVFRADTAMWCHTGFMTEDGVSAHNFLIDRCVIIQCGINSADRPAFPGYQLNGHSYELLGQDHLIVRYNVAINDTNLTGSYIPSHMYWDEMGISPDLEGGVVWADATNYYVYNNTIWGRCGNSQEHYIVRVEIPEAGQVTQNINVKNNIFARETNSPTMVYEANRYGYVNQTVDFDNHFTNNIFYRTSGTGSDVGAYEDAGGYVGSFTISELESSYPARWSSNTLENPVFADTTSRGRWINLGLQASSPAIDASDPLTYANGGGSGTSLTVDDAGYFWGGNELVPADSIMIGSVKRQISSISGNVITLTQTATWSDNTPIYYYSWDKWIGNYPDIGALEYGTPAPPAEGAEPSIPGKMVIVR
jgi:hypothetical protein